MTDNEFTDLNPVEKLFALASKRGDERAPILTGEHVRVAARLLKREPDRYGKLLGRMAGWHSLSVFKQRVQKLLAEAEATFKKKRSEAEAEERLDEARERGLPIVAIGEPVTIAQDFVAQVRPNLIFWQGEFFDHEVNIYVALEEKGVRSQVQDFMNSGVNATTGEPCHPNKQDLDRVMDALGNLLFREGRSAAPPVWFDYFEGVDPYPQLCLAALNGVLDIKNRSLMPPTPRYFTRNGLSFNYDPNAPEPKLWLNFLEQVWPEDEGGAENKDALQEIMGHLLTCETKYQKIFMLVGESRGGKGVITRVMTELVGNTNVLSQSANDFGETFGLQPLIDKTLMVVPDLRFGRNANHGSIVEKLLTISGEDKQSIGRKYLPNWSGTLKTRIVIAANKPPMLPDQSGALAARLVPLVFTRSFAGREDVNLTDKLLKELPGILNWSLEGLRRLEARPGFVLTSGGKNQLEIIRRNSAPVRFFLNECCEVSPSGQVPKDELFRAFEGWHDENNISKPYTLETFAQELFEAGRQAIDKARPRIDGERVQVFTGVRFKPEFENYEWEPAEDF